MNKIKNRPLGTNEKVYWVLDQKTSTQFAVVAEIDGNLADDEWRKALDIVQKRHPILSVQIAGNHYTTAHFKHVDNCQIPLRILHTQRNESWNSLLEEELSNPFDITIAPLARTVLIQQPGKSIFMFLSNHSIGDGMSVALVIRDVLTVLSGKKIENLPSISTLDKIAGTYSKEIEIENPDGFEQVKNSLLQRPSVNVQFLRFSSALTSKLINPAKS